MAILIVLVPSMLCLIDRRIKGCRSVVVKIINVLVVTGFVLFGVYFFGQQILATFRINIKSFTSMKAFFSSRILVWLLLLIFVLLIALKFVFTVVLFKTTNIKTTKLEKTVILLAVFFDLALVPNILTSATAFAVFGVFTLVELGLVYTKLVFSIFNKKEIEVLA